MLFALKVEEGESGNDDKAAEQIEETAERIKYVAKDETVRRPRFPYPGFPRFAIFRVVYQLAVQLPGPLRDEVVELGGIDAVVDVARIVVQALQEENAEGVQHQVFHVVRGPEQTWRGQRAKRNAQTVAEGVHEHPCPRQVRTVEVTKSVGLDIHACQDVLPVHEDDAQEQSADDFLRPGLCARLQADVLELARVKLGYRKQEGADRREHLDEDHDDRHESEPKTRVESNSPSSIYVAGGGIHSLFLFVPSGSEVTTDIAGFQSLLLDFEAV
mmetsp:Transcript_18713/g.51389  ORF Transcript_18713/g.51389 Transcript_18713/m.51389 type:complete len:272 (+) Transcript_18713:335-1150(+)